MEMKRRIVSLAMALIAAVGFAQSARKFSLTTESDAVENSFGRIKVMVQIGHDASVKYIQYSSDGKYICSADNLNLNVWDAKTGKLLHTAKKKQDLNAKNFAFSPFGKSYVYVSIDGNVKFCDIEHGKEKIFDDSFDSASFEHNIVFSQDGSKFAVTCKDGSIRVYDAYTQKLLYMLEDKNWIPGEALFTPDAKNLVMIAGKNGQRGTHVAIWDIKEKAVKKSVSLGGHLFKDLNISPDGTRIACHGSYGSTDKGAAVITDVGCEKVLAKVVVKPYPNIEGLSFSPDGSELYLSYDDEILIYNSHNGKKIGSKEVSLPHSISFSADGNTCAVGGFGDIRIYTAADFSLIQKIRGFSDIKDWFYDSENDSIIVPSTKKIFDNSLIAHVLPLEDYECYFTNGKWSYNNGKIVLHEFKNGKKLEFAQVSGSPIFLKNSNDRIMAYYAKSERKIFAYDVKTRKLIHEFKPENESDIFLSPDGRYVVCSGLFGPSEVVDLKNGNRVKINGYKLTFSLDCRYYALLHMNKIGTSDVTIYDAGSGKSISTLSGNYSCSYAPLCFSPDEKYILVSEYASRTSKVIDWKTGREIREFADMDKATFTFDGKKIIGMSYDGIIRCYSVETGELLASCLADKTGDWLAYTPEGYFTGSEGGINKSVHVVDGMKVMELGQIAESFYRPDLVAAKFRGEDISGSGLPTLHEVIASGDAPTVKFASMPASSSSRDVTVSFTVQDMGGGIGSVYMSLNGKVIQIADGSRKFELTGGTDIRPSGKSVPYSQTLTLASGENTIGAWATNAAGKIESRRAEVKISWRGASSRPTLHVLAVGVNKYRTRGVKPLNYAVPDVHSFSEALKSAGKGMYSSVSVTELTDEKATSAGIASEFSRLSGSVKADDVFVLYISGHGTAYNGDYYFIPVDFDGNLSSAVSKKFIMTNLQKIAAQRTLIILDTCYSGAIVNSSDTTAYQRLSHSTGQAILAASSDAQEALEGHMGHGVFTYALLEGLSGKADLMKDGAVSLMELATYLSGAVPSITEKKWNYRQIPWHDTRGQDFQLVGK